MARYIPTFQLKQSLKDYPKYQLTERQVKHEIPHIIADETTESWLSIYKPILIIGGYITGISLLVEVVKTDFSLEDLMTNFMSGFFLVFSFFIMLDLKGFSESYAMYDIIAKRWSGWAYVYAFTELGLGIAYFLHLNLFVTNVVTIAVMSISVVGVLQSVLNKRKIKCACLGAVFNLPMSTITIIEDSLMIAMSLTAVITTAL